MFVVKRDNDVLCVPFTGGDVLNLTDIQAMNGAPPTDAMMSSMTIDQTIQMVRRMSSKITNAKSGGRDLLMQYVIDRWGDFTTRLVQHGVRTHPSVGRSSLVVLNVGGVFIPFPTTFGQVYDITELQNLVPTPLTNGMVAPMVMDDLKKMINWVGFSRPCANKIGCINILVQDFNRLTGGNLGNDTASEDDSSSSETEENEGKSDGNEEQDEETKGDENEETENKGDENEAQDVKSASRPNLAMAVELFDSKAFREFTQKCSKNSNRPEWSEMDEVRLNMLEAMNSKAGIHVNSWELAELRQKKARCLEGGETDDIAVMPMKDGDHLNQKTGDMKTLTIKSNDKKVLYHYDKSSLVADVADKLNAKYAIDVKQFKLYLGESPLEFYDCIDTYVGDMPSPTLTMRVVLQGGGRGVKKSDLKSKKSSALTTSADEKVFSSAFQCAKTISSCETFTLGNLLEYMTPEQHTEALSIIVGKSNTNLKIEAFAEFSPSWVQLEVAKEKIELAQAKMKERLVDSIMNECSVGRKFKRAELEKRLEISKAVKLGVGSASVGATVPNATAMTD